MHSILHNVYIRSQADLVFRALTRPKDLNQWWTLKSEGQAELHEEYRFFFSAEFDWTARVSRLVPQKALEWKMLQADADWTPTSFGFELFQQGDQTKVEFYHKDWSSTNEHFRRTSFCWAMYLNLLKNYLEKNEVIPFAERKFA